MHESGINLFWQYKGNYTHYTLRLLKEKSNYKLSLLNNQDNINDWLDLTHQDLLEIAEKIKQFVEKQE